jgi:uncharacterized protein (DUF433 family)
MATIAQDELRQLAEAEQMVVSDPEILHGTPVFRGTRIPVHDIAEMLSQGAAVDEILEGYPALTRDWVAAAPVYAKAFPHRGSSPVRPSTKRRPRRVTTRRLANG